MAAAHVQSLGTTRNGLASQTSTVLTISKTVTSGYTIVVGWGSILGGGATGVTDNLGNTYTKVESTTRSLANAELWYAPVTSAGTLTTITVSHASSQYVRLAAAEISGVATAPTAAGGTTGVYPSVTAAWMASGTIPADGMAIGFETHNDIKTFTAGAASGSPSTTIYLSTPSANDYYSIAYAIAGGSQVTSFTGTTTFDSAPGAWAGAGAIFSPTAAPGGSTAYPTTATATGAANNAQVSTGGGGGTGTLAQRIAAAAAGSTINLTGLTFTEVGVTINKALTIIGGTFYYPTGYHGIRITASNVTIDGMTIVGPGGTYVPMGGAAEHCIYVPGPHTAHLSGITIKNCSLYYPRSTAIWYEHTTDTIVHHNFIRDCGYAGIIAFCATGGSITWNDVSGMAAGGTEGENAYNIAVTGDYGWVSSDVSVTDNYVDDNRLWHGIDTHSGIRITFARNIIRRCARPLFITDRMGPPTDIIVRDNWFLSPDPYTYDLVPLTFYHCLRVTVTNNRYIDWGGQSPPAATPWYDYAGTSTGLVNGGGNVIITGAGAATSVNAYVSDGTLTGATTGTGTAHNATTSNTKTSRSVYPERASGSGIARQATTTITTPSVQVSPATATASGAANNVSATKTPNAISAPAGRATGVGYAHNPPFGAVARPTISVRVDFANDGFGSGLPDDISASILSDSLSWTRGRSADFSAEATGEARFTVRNDDGRYTTTTFLPGMAVHISAVYSGVVYPLFYGFIERVAPDPVNKTIGITCYDVLRKFDEVDVVVPANSLVPRSARDFRLAALEDYERGTRNLVANPRFVTDTTGWSIETLDGSGGSVTRVTGDGAQGSTSAEWISGTGTRCRLIYSSYTLPVFRAGETYHASVYLRTVSGTASVDLVLDSASSSRTVTVTSTWTRYSVTRTLTDDQASVAFWLSATDPSVSLTVRVDGAMLTRGQALYPYVDAGSGRWPNWCANGSFDSSSLNGWLNGWKNLVANPSFETDTTGWSTAGDSFVTSGGSLTRVASDPAYGSCHAALTVPAATAGAFFAITGTFVAGRTYDVSCYACTTEIYSVYAHLGIGSNGTPIDKASEALVLLTSSWARVTTTWTPTASRTDAHLYIYGGTMKVDAFMVNERDASSLTVPRYANVGPSGGMSSVTSRALSTTARWGSHSLELTTPATAAAGYLYDLGLVGNPVFVADQPYTLSVWLRPSSSMTYRIGLAANDGNGGWDEASTSGVAPAGTWTNAVTTWTPTADRTADLLSDVVAYVKQVDATARTVLVDGVRIIPGSSADDFEMTQWSLGAEDDALETTATASGSALAVLGQLNGYTLARHWIEPEAASPWYTYRSRGRDDLASKTSAETYDDDLNDMTAAEVDRASIINHIAVTSGSGTSYYSDATSIGQYGLRPGAAISAPTFISQATADAIGPALVARYAQPQARPKITVVNRFPSQLVRELDDLVTVNFARLGIVAGTYLIAGLTTTIAREGNWWQTEYQLEAY